MANVPDYLKRLITEQELNESNLNKLILFLDEQNYLLTVTEEELDLLIKQKDIMSDLNTILKRRIAVAALKIAYVTDQTLPETPNWDNAWSDDLKTAIKFGYTYIYSKPENFVYEIINSDSVKSIGYGKDISTPELDEPLELVIDDIKNHEKVNTPFLVLNEDSDNPNNIIELNFDSKKYEVLTLKDLDFDNKIENELVALGADAPRLKPESLELKIIEEKYIKLSERMMICILILENGYEVIGESSCIDPKNFDEGIGKQVSKQNAINKFWPIEGYLLKEKIYQESLDGKKS